MVRVVGLGIPGGGEGVLFRNAGHEFIGIPKAEYMACFVAVKRLLLRYDCRMSSKRQALGSHHQGFLRRVWLRVPSPGLAMRAYQPAYVS